MKFKSGKTAIDFLVFMLRGLLLLRSLINFNYKCFYEKLNLESRKKKIQRI